jgi:hypothetical protein
MCNWIRETGACREKRGNERRAGRIVLGVDGEWLVVPGGTKKLYKGHLRRQLPLI